MWSFRDDEGPLVHAFGPSVGLTPWLSTFCANIAAAGKLYIFIYCFSISL